MEEVLGRPNNLEDLSILSVRTMVCKFDLENKMVFKFNSGP